MMAFDHVFLDVARLESRAIQMTLASGAPATFLFRELYCAVPGCDCRRVVLEALWVERRAVAASINYWFEPSRRRDEPQITLDPMTPQSQHAEVLLEVFTRIVETEPAYRETLRRHYAMCKAVVDDPDHVEVPGPRRPAAAANKARTRRPRAQGSAGAGELERVAARAAQADGKLQRRFRRLLAKVDRARQQLRAWRDQRPAIDSAIAAYRALCEQRLRRTREMVTLLDAAYTREKLGKAERKELAEVITSLAGELLETGHHDDLKPLYNRYRGGDFDAEAAASEAAGMDALKGMLETFGLDLEDADVRSIDELREVAKARLEEAERAEAEAAARRAQRKKSPRQLAAEQRRAAEQGDAHRAVQEVYRTLARELHPDREQDPGERARKTELMREVNLAYEAKDLLRLLELQLQHERVDAAGVEALAEERVRHYNRILDEQAKQLAAELAELELPFRLELGLPPTAPLRPALVLATIGGDAELLRAQIDALVHDLEAFRDARRLRAWLKEELRQRQPRRRNAERQLFD